MVIMVIQHNCLNRYKNHILKSSYWIFGCVFLLFILGLNQCDCFDPKSDFKQVWVIDVGPGKAEDKSQYQELVDALQKLHTLPSLFPSQE